MFFFGDRASQLVGSSQNVRGGFLDGLRVAFAPSGNVSDAIGRGVEP